MWLATERARWSSLSTTRCVAKENFPRKPYNKSLTKLVRSRWPDIGLVLFSLMSRRIERKYCLISTSYLAGVFDIFMLLHIWQNRVCLGDFLPMWTLCDAYHEEFELLAFNLRHICPFLHCISVHKHAEKELRKYPASLTSHLVDNPY